MYSNLSITIRPHRPWMYDINGFNCKGIHCQLLGYVSKSLNYSYYFDLNKEWFKEESNTSDMSKVSYNYYL